MNNFIDHKDGDLSREHIISYLRNHFFGISTIQACWLGGSDANDESDEFSDIDIYLSV